MSGIATVIWNHDGAIMASCAEKLNQTCKAEEIEALAALRALQLAYDLGSKMSYSKGTHLG